MRNFSTRLKNRDYPATTVEKHLSEVIFADRKKALEQRNKNASKKILPFVTQYHPALPNLKNILMGRWHLMQNQPYLRNIFKETPLISYRKGKSPKDTQVRAKRGGHWGVPNSAITYEKLVNTAIPCRK